MSQLPEGQELTPSLLFIYFMFGFLIGVILTMVCLSLIRPFLPMEALWVKTLVMSPLIGGIFMGNRVIAKAKPHRLSLFAAIKAAIFGQN